MAVIMILQVDGFGTDAYEAMNDEMGIRSADDLPEGCIAHAAGATEDGVLVVDVWESPETFGRFVESRLAPTAQKLGLSQLTPRMIPVHNRIQVGSGTTAGVIVLIETPMTPEQYDGLTANMAAHDGDGAAHPAVSHTAGIEDGRIVVVHVWESPEAFERFLREQIAPAAGGELPPMEPRIVPAHNHMRSATAAPA
jgi:heme-degrading monooxygenase HmoA